MIPKIKRVPKKNIEYNDGYRWEVVVDETFSLLSKTFVRAFLLWRQSIKNLW